MIRKRTGLAGADHVLLGVRRAMARAGVEDAHAYVSQLTTDPAVFSELITEMTVGETYFLREREQFDFIAREVLPDLRERRRSADVIRAWSAACSTGEEAYSLAIVGQTGGLWPPVRVLGTDIADSRLATARHAVYGEWSLRGVPADTVSRYFRRADRRVTVVPEIRAMVDFRHLNLASPSWSTAGIGPASMDLILCRNVLIYLDSATIAHIAKQLIDTLRDGGWLFLGASDPALKDYVDCEVVITGAGIAYRRNGTTSAVTHAAGVTNQHWRAKPPAEVDYRPLDATAPPLPAPVVPSKAEPALRPAIASVGRREEATRLMDDALRHYRSAEYARAAEVARELVTVDGRNAAAWIILVRSLANLGRHDEAGLACASGLDVNRTSAELTYIHAMLLRQAARHEDALHALRCAVYLDRGFVVAHLAMGDVLSLLGDRAAARRAFRNAERLLSATPAGDAVPGADGLQASRLLALAQMQLVLLEREKAQ